MSHLTYVQAIVTGIVQGVTELFPISSLGHNVLIPALIGGSWAKDLSVSAKNSPYLAFIVGLHVATALAMILYFRRDWVRIVRGFFSSLRIRRVETADQRLAWMIVAATIPVGIAGLLLQKVFTTVFAKPTLTACFLAINGVILLYSERQRRRPAAGPAEPTEWGPGDQSGGYGGGYDQGGGYSQQPRQQQWQGPGPQGPGPQDPEYDPRYGRPSARPQQPRFEPNPGQGGQRPPQGGGYGQGAGPGYGQGGGPGYGQGGAGRGGAGQGGGGYAQAPAGGPSFTPNPDYQQPPPQQQRDPRSRQAGGDATYVFDARHNGPDPRLAREPRMARGAHEAKNSEAVEADGRLASMSIQRAMLIGAAQILALLPGISRDGIVTVAGMGKGLSRQDAVRFSFLLSAPVILLAGVLKVGDLFGPEGKGIHGPVLVGSILAGVGAYLSVRFLTKYFSESRSLRPFGIYCIIAGVLSLAYLTLH
jgi:undecaprenyl pyrophosphate phosphatase UppP